MIAVKLNGGIGNQIFTLAAAFSLGWDNNDSEIRIVLQKEDEATRPHAFKNYFPCIDQSECKDVYKETSFSYRAIPYRPGMCLEGYFQSEKYFAHNRDRIMQAFRFGGYPYEAKHGVSVHVRRTDYLATPNFHPVPDISWYINQMMVLHKRGYTDFFICSDDIGWCIENFSSNAIGLNLEFSAADNTDPMQDMRIASQYEHNIGSNSSFSWWIAWLNRNPNKMCIFPKQWFGPDGPKDIQDLLPASFYKV